MLLQLGIPKTKPEYPLASASAAGEGFLLAQRRTVSHSYLGRGIVQFVEGFIWNVSSHMK